MWSSVKPVSAIPALLLALALPLAQAHAAASILVWPVDPVIEHDERAAALWIENRGNAPSLLQLRIFAWSQEDGADRYADQAEIVGTPPMIRIEPGKRQLVRLTRIIPTPPGVERAFRVVIDEVPMQAAPETPAAPAVGLKFQFRYSIPLFVYGEGLWWKIRADRRRNPQSAGQPDLSWRIFVQNGQKSLEIRNGGTVHARLTGAYFRQGGTELPLAQGLFCYVLAGSSILRPIADGATATATLNATVNGSPRTLTMAAPRE